jgi:hypothetical protein
MRDPYDVFERDVDQTRFEERTEDELDFLDEVFNNDEIFVEIINDSDIDQGEYQSEQDEAQQEYDLEQAELEDLAKPVSL